MTGTWLARWDIAKPLSSLDSIEQMEKRVEIDIIPSILVTQKASIIN